MSLIGVADVAAELGVSTRRVRQMLADGSLAGERVGRAWVIDSEHVRRLRDRKPGVGRPWSPSSAWAVLAFVDGEEPALSALDRSRARKRLAQGFDVVVSRLGSRADPKQFYAHPGVLDRLAGDPAVVRGGAHAAVDHGAGLVVGSDFEGYVRASDFDRLVQRFGLDADGDRPNVMLRVVDDATWPFAPGQVIAGRAVVAVDLLESPEPRLQRAGSELVELLQ